MNGALPDRERGFLHRLGQRRMRVHRARNAPPPEHDRQRRFRDRVRRTRREAVEPDDPVGADVGQHLDAAVGLAETARVQLDFCRPGKPTDRAMMGVLVDRREPW